MAPMTAQERRHCLINKAINLILQHRLPEALTQLRSFDHEYCTKKLRKQDKTSSNNADNANQQEEVKD
jgi:hypothetical protein